MSTVIEANNPSTMVLGQRPRPDGFAALLEDIADFAGARLVRDSGRDLA